MVGDTSTESDDDALDWDDDLPVLDIPSEDVELTIGDKMNEDEEPRKKKGSSSASRGPSFEYVRDDLLRSSSLHWRHMVRALHSGRAAVREVTNEILGSFLLNLIPTHLRVSIRDFGKLSHEKRMQQVRQLVQWFQSCVGNVMVESGAPTAEPSSATDAETLMYLAQCIPTKSMQGTRRQICLVFMALLQASGLDPRLVLRIDPPSWRPASYWNLYKRALVRGLERSRSSKNAKKDGGSGDVEDAAEHLDWAKIKAKWRSAQTNVKRSTECWVEFYLGSKPVVVGGSVDHPIGLDSDDEGREVSAGTSSSATGVTSSTPRGGVTEQHNHVDRWVHVDPVSADVDAPEVAGSRASGDDSSRLRVVQYVCGVDPRGRCTDISLRYITAPSKSEALRLQSLQQKWMLHLTSFNCIEPTADAHANGQQLREKLAEQELYLSRCIQEQSQLKEALKNIPKPNTMSGYKNHPQYVLDCQGYMRAREIVKPGCKAVAIFNGHKVYRREDIVEVLSRAQWRANLREVKRDEVEKPVKTRAHTDGRNKRKVPGGSVQNAEKFDVKLYGLWQTEEIKVAPVVDDVIPVNKYGNVEVWNGQDRLVPAGARFFGGKNHDLSVAKQACKNLGVHYVEAVTGFDSDGPSNRPKLGGIVLLERHYDLVKDAVDALQEHARQKKAGKAAARKAAEEAEVARHAQRRDELRQKYGA